MRIHVRLFSILRACLPPGAQRGEATINMPEGATVGDVIVHLGVDRYLGVPAAEVGGKAGWQVMVEGRHEPDVNRVLREEERVAIFPPVSGG